MNSDPQTTVIKLGGNAVSSLHFSPQLAQSLAQLHLAARNRNQRLVIVHGGGRSVDQQLERANITPTRYEGLRVTPTEHLPFITAAIVGETASTLEAALLAAGAPAIATTLHGSGILCQPHPLAEQLGSVGVIAPNARPNRLNALLDHSLLPVIACVGATAQGNLLNINADDAATGIARITHAASLILLTDVPAVLDKQHNPIRNLTPDHAEELINDRTITQGMIPKVRAAIDAANAINAPVTITSWEEELSTGSPAGTTISPSIANASQTPSTAAATA